jgi:hypothetical protein
MPIMPISEIQARHDAADDGIAVAPTTKAKATAIAQKYELLGVLLELWEIDEARRAAAIEGQPEEPAAQKATEHAHQQILAMWQRRDAARQTLIRATEIAWDAYREISGEKLFWESQETFAGNEFSAGSIAQKVIDAQWGVMCEVVGARFHQTVAGEWFGPIELHPKPGAVLSSTTVLPEDRDSIVGWEQM